MFTLEKAFYCPHFTVHGREPGEWSDPPGLCGQRTAGPDLQNSSTAGSEPVLCTFLPQKEIPD